MNNISEIKQFLSVPGIRAFNEAISGAVDTLFDSDTAQHDGLVSQITDIINMAEERGTMSSDQVNQLDDLKKQVAGYGDGWIWSRKCDDVIAKYGRYSMLKEHFLWWLEHIGLPKEQSSLYIDEHRDDQLVKFALNKDWFSRWGVAKEIGTELGIPGFAEATCVDDLEKAVEANRANAETR